MVWAVGIVLACVAVVVALPVPRRACAVGLVGVRRFAPLLWRRRGDSKARAVRLAFEDLGPAYIKFGQMIASSPTAFPEHVTEEFARCLDEVRPVPVRVVWQILERELGGHPEQVFARIDERPLASASIAQVHAAELQDGTHVVVKVQRPGIRGRIERDLGLLEFLARVAMRVDPDLRRANLPGIVDDFRRTLREEMDFRLEADNIEAFNALLAREGHADKACAPRVYRELTTATVLTMQRFYGVRIDDKAGVDARVADVVEMLRHTSLVFWSSVFLGGFFHGDIHAGNIMVLDDGRLGYLDFGIFGRFSDEHRVALADWVGAMISGNGEQLARSIAAMGAVPDTVDWDAYVADVTQIFLPLRALTVDKPEMLDGLLPRVRDFAVKHDCRLPGEFVLILKQLSYFGRYVMLHEPSFNENLDPKMHQYFAHIFMKFHHWKTASAA